MKVSDLQHVQQSSVQPYAEANVVWRAVLQLVDRLEGFLNRLGGNSGAAKVSQATQSVVGQVGSEGAQQAMLRAAQRERPVATPRTPRPSLPPGWKTVQAGVHQLYLPGNAELDTDHNGKVWSDGRVSVSHLREIPGHELTTSLVVSPPFHNAFDTAQQLRRDKAAYDQDPHKDTWLSATGVFQVSPFYENDLTENNHRLVWWGYLDEPGEPPRRVTIAVGFEHDRTQPNAKATLQKTMAELSRQVEDLAKQIFDPNSLTNPLT